ncbi:MAG: HIT family protein [Nanoarchaeota archaeon]|nr:HIT family protein [Nanoarchaeota archaeon]
MSSDCVFCKIVEGKIPCHKVWENENYLAFLSIFPNTLGTTVVIPKKHYSSYAFNLPDKILKDLIIATKKVAKLIDSNLNDVGRTALVFEGFGVDHVHSKLFPMHGTGNMGKWKSLESENKMNAFFEKYPGFISSHDSYKMSDKELVKIASKIRGE